jgi:hypothetical protein
MGFTHLGSTFTAAIIFTRFWSLVRASVCVCGKIRCCDDDGDGNGDGDDDRDGDGNRDGDGKRDGDGDGDSNGEW